MKTRFPLASALIACAWAREAAAADPTPGYPEAVIQWGVQKGESCDDIAKAVYGSAKHVGLLNRYNRISCKKDTPLPEGLTLVLPEKVGTVPDAKLRSMNPDVRTRPSGSGWSPAATGMPLYSNSSVNTLDKGRADVIFVDRTRVFLAPNTLVVIYGTANQTSVSKTPPVAVEVETGEVKAGLAALRGDAKPEPGGPKGSVEIAIKGGGRVSAASRDTVVQQRGDRTTVEVFNGKAGVKSGGQTVTVPENFGTRFVNAAAPTPPRPLPLAPEWVPEPGTDKVLTPTLALAPGGRGILAVTWGPVPTAASYRLEVARDATFNDLVVREEVPADIHAFRAENTPPGTYRVRVRAIDKEEFLGVASTDRVIRLVDASIDTGSVTPHAIDANPYGTLRFTPTPELEMSLDDGPFGPMPKTLDLQKRAPHTITLHPRDGGPAQPFVVQYSKVSASLTTKLSADHRSLAIEVTPSGLDGIDIPSRVAPTVRAHLPGDLRTVRLTPQGNVLAGALALPANAASGGPLRLDVVDDRGSVLGSTEVDVADHEPPPPPKPAEPLTIPRIGVAIPLWPVSAVTDVVWYTPTTPNEGSAGMALARVNNTWTFQGQARASGAVGPVGFDAAIRSDPSGNVPHEGGAWLGARVRALRYGRAEFELAPALRLGIPTASTGAPARLEALGAIGGAEGAFTWLANIGWGARLANDGGKAGAAPVQAFGMAGGTYDIRPSFRVHLLLDGHLVHRDTGKNDLLGGFGGGLELGGQVFGAMSLRVSPLSATDESPFAAQLCLGVREASP